jgi:hypothetical protein
MTGKLKHPKLSKNFILRGPNLEMILHKIKQKQRVILGLCIGFNLVHLLNDFLKAGPAIGDFIVPEMIVVYLNPFQNCQECDIRLGRNNQG